MKFNKILLISALIFGSFIQILAQEAKWIRVQSDNGEFSIEVPENYGFFFDKDGYPIFNSGSDYYLREMVMLNAYHEKTLVSFESFKANKFALDILREKETRNGKTSDLKIGETKIKQIIYETKTSYTVRRYFNSKDYIYIITASSRTGETAAMKRFFDSMIFGAEAKTTDSSNVRFSNLKQTPIEIETAGKMPKPSDDNSVLPVPTDKDTNINKLVIPFKPLPSYTNIARQNLSQGNVKLRITFSKDGWISKIGFVQVLPDGLLRQSIFAAIRIKFLPQERDEVPVTVAKTVEYSFRVY